MTIQHFGKPPALDVNRMLEDAARIHRTSKRQIHGDERYPSQTRPVARGAVTRAGLMFSVALDEDTVDEIRRRAERDSTSFAEQIRMLVEWGLEADADALLR